MNKRCCDARADGQPFRKILWLVFGDGIPRRSAKVALVVGTALNLINQFDVLGAGKGLNWVQICLTYCVPYCVATYGAVMARLTMGEHT